MKLLSGFLATLTLLLSNSAFGQKGYIMIDSAYATGFIENRGAKLNSKEIRFRKSQSSPITTYLPATVTEFGFNDVIYRSRKVSTASDSTQLFLLILANGDVTLYMVKTDGEKRFFAEHGDKFIELKKNDKAYQEEIQQLFTGCEDYKSYLSDLQFNKRAFRRFFTLQNKCYKGPWPLARWNAIVGYVPTELSIINAYGEKLNFGTDATLFFGVGVELPIGTRPNWSVTLQTLYQQTSYQKSTEYFGEFEFRESDYDIKVSAITLPVLIKYGVPIESIFKAYILTGPSLAYNLKRESFMKENIVRASEHIINEDDSDLVSKVNLGGTVGLGIEYYLNHKLSIGLEGRYTTAKGLGTDGHSLSMKQFGIIVSF